MGYADVTRETPNKEGHNQVIVWNIVDMDPQKTALETNFSLSTFQSGAPL